MSIKDFVKDFQNLQVLMVVCVIRSYEFFSKKAE